MQDILFDIITREVVMFKEATPTEDMKLTSNPSVQNGGILLFSRCANVTNPIPGIGMEQVMNGNSYNATFEMNRWKQQCLADGATLATWNGVTENNVLKFTTDQSYI